MRPSAPGLPTCRIGWQRLCTPGAWLRTSYLFQAETDSRDQAAWVWWDWQKPLAPWQNKYRERPFPDRRFPCGLAGSAVSGSAVSKPAIRR